MSRPNVYGERVSTAVRLPKELHERLCAEAQQRDVSINLLATKAISRYLDSLSQVPE